MMRWLRILFGRPRVIGVVREERHGGWRTYYEGEEHLMEAAMERIYGPPVK